MNVSFKRIIALLLVIFCLCGCSFSDPQDPGYYKHQLNYFITESPEYGIPTYNEWEFSSIIPISEEWQKFLDTHIQSQAEFMNDTYGTDWTYDSVEAYGVNLEESNLGFTIGGIYDPLTNRIYLDDNMLASPPSEISAEQMAYIAHEAQHWLKAHNTGSPLFIIFRKKVAMGNAFSEAVTNLAAIKWLTANGYGASAEYLQSCGYASVTVLCQQLELSVPELLQYYGNNNIEELENVFNTACRLHIDGSDNSMFETWVWTLCRIYELEHRYRASNAPFDMAASMRYFFSALEVLAAITAKEDSKDFWSMFWAYADLYYDQAYRQLPSETFDPIRALFYEEPETIPSNAG